MSSESWIDAAHGGTESASFVPSVAGLVLIHEHCPATVTTPPVVLCPSLFEELQNNRRREVLLARRLAAGGTPVVHVEYRGFGNSDDVPAPGPTVATLLEDVDTAIVRARALGPGPVTLVGYRLGALLAACVIATAGGSLVLWEPAHGGREYLRELSRADHIAQLRTRADIEVHPDANGTRELLGWVISAATYDSIAAASYPASIGAAALFVHVSRMTTVRGPITAVLDRWTATGGPITRVHVTARRDPWFVPEKWEPQEGEVDTVEIVDAIASWVAARA